MKLISIITVVLNRAETIQYTIESVLGQLTNQVEFIIIDGGSIDGTVDVIKKYSDRISYWSSELDDGIYDAWNKGVAVSTGKYICFVGADDFLSSDMIQKCINHVSKSDYDYVSFKAILNNSQKRIIGNPWVWNKFKRFMNVSHVGSLHNRSLYVKYGLYNTHYKIAGDYEFLLRIGSKLKYSYIDFVGATMGVDGISNKLVLLSLAETFTAKNSTNACGLFLCVFDYLIAYIKYILRCFISRIS